MSWNLAKLPETLTLFLTRLKVWAGIVLKLFRRRILFASSLLVICLLFFAPLSGQLYIETFGVKLSVKHDREGCEVLFDMGKAWDKNILLIYHQCRFAPQEEDVANESVQQPEKHPVNPYHLAGEYDGVLTNHKGEKVSAVLTITSMRSIPQGGVLSYEMNTEDFLRRGDATLTSGMLNINGISCDFYRDRHGTIIIEGSDPATLANLRFNKVEL